MTRWLKHKRIASADLLEKKSSYACMRLLKRWRARKDTTIAARGAFIKFHEKRDLMYTKAVFYALKLKYQREKALVLKLANLAKKFDNFTSQTALQMIQNYSKSKKDINGNDKNVATRGLTGCLAKIYKRKLLQHYTHLRRQCHGDKLVTTKKKVMFGHFITKQVRECFNRWKRQAQYQTTVIEVNEIGPVVEQVLDKQMDVANLRNLMKDEAFTGVQVEDITHSSQDKGLELISRAIGRWKHWNGTDDYLKPKMFDRWKQFVKMRRIVKHWLNFIENRQQHQKSDLSHSFFKWKHFFADKERHLQKNVLK